MMMPSLRCLVLLLCLTLAACQSGPALHVGLTQAQAAKLGLQVNGPIAATPDGQVVLSASDSLYRYDPARGTFDNLLVSPEKSICDLAASSEGVILVLSPDRLQAFLSGYLVEVARTPAPASLLSSHGDAAYLLSHSQGSARLLRYTFSSRQWHGLATTPDTIQALCAVPGGCLIASNGSVHKLAVAKAPNSPSVSLLLFALPKTVISLAADPSRKIVYASDGEMTYAWAHGTIFPLCPFGGRLAWANDTLTVVRSANNQVLQVQNVSGRVAALEAQMEAAPSTQPKP